VVINFQPLLAVLLSWK